MQDQDKRQKQQTNPPIDTNQNQAIQTNTNVNNNQQIVQQQQQNHSHSYHSQSSSSRSYSSRSNSSQSNKQSKKSQENKDNKQQKQQEVEKKKDPIREQQPQRKIRYKYCCKVCKHTDKSKKACVCVVPKGQRRTQIGSQGCQTCGCVGCSKQDFISRGEDPQYKPGQKKKNRKDRQKQTTQFQARNGCCRKCMKAFSKSNKSCLCQVPQDVRNTKLPSSGCKICGCFGCNPQDKKDPRHRKTSRKQKQRSRSRQKQKRKKHIKSKSPSSSQKSIEQATMNFYNIDKSVLGTMMVNQYRIDPSLLGFGIPQRTYSYIIGKPK